MITKIINRKYLVVWLLLFALFFNLNQARAAFLTGGNFGTSQWSGDTNSIYYGGKVGVGAISPGAKFDISGGQVFVQGVSPTSSQLKLTGVGSNDAILQFGTASNGRLIYLDESDSNKLKITGGGLTDLVTIDNAGNVGVGTTSPTAKLQIDLGQGANVFGAEGLTLKNANATGNYSPSMYFRNSYYPNYMVREHANFNDLIIQGTTNGSTWTETARFSNGTSNSYLGLNGKVGIGTTGPNEKLEVAGTISSIAVTTGAESNYLRLSTYSVGGVYGSYIKGTSNYASTLNTNLYLGVSNSGTHLDAVTILSSGNVGIGKTPSILFDVNGAGSFSGNISATGGTFGILAGSGTRIVMSDNLGNIYATSSSIASGLPPATTAGQTLRATGAVWQANSVLYNNGTNVGIGTTAPGALLQLGSPAYRYTGTTPVAHFYDGTRSTALRIQSANTSAGNYGPRIEFEPYSVDANAVKTAIVAVDNYYGYKKTDLFFVLDNANDANVYDISADTKMVIKNSGNIGIGTTNPATKLHVDGGIKASRLGYSGTYDPTQVQGIWSIADNYVIDQAANTFGSQYGIVYAHTNASSTGLTNGPIANFGHQILFVNGGTRNAAISLSGQAYFGGNVGIGTTNPGYKLQVVGTSAGDKFVTQWGSAAAPTYSFMADEDTGIYNGASGNSLGFVTAGAARMTINNSGNVGISTTAPDNKLQINGGTGEVLNASGGFIHGLNSTPVSADQAVPLGYLQANYGPSSSSLWLGTKNGNIWNGDAGVGNVGIGTTNPQTKLQVGKPTFSSEDIGVVPNVRIFGAPHSSASNTLLRLMRDTNSGISYGAGVDFKIDAWDTLGSGDGYLPHTRLTIALKSNAVVTETANVDVLSLLDSGNVGISTTVPAAKLDVNGAAIIRGNLDVSSYTVSALKLTVGTIDPLYEIKGRKYSTFAASVVDGVKEEITGRAKINLKKGNEYQLIIDFDTIEKSSPLWVWRQVIDFDSNTVEASITPYGGFANVYFYIKDNTLVFRADRPTEISYRLIAKRFDWRNWPLIANDQSEKASFIIK